MGDNSSAPVIACINTVGTGLSLSSRPKVIGSSLANSQLILRGSGFGSNEQNITGVRVGMDTCNRVELCSGHQCLACKNTGTCPLDTICLSDQTSNTGSCYIICTMQNDTSCPCDHICQTIAINTYTSSIFLSVCVPTDGTGKFLPCITLNLTQCNLIKPHTFINPPNVFLHGWNRDMFVEITEW